MRDGVAVAKMEEVRKDLQACCAEAADACPVQAIIIDG